MANVKFSQFSATTISATGFIVGYDSALNDNIRFTLAQLQTAMTLNNISGTLTSSKGGMLTGGTISQVLAKNSSTNYDSSWTTLALDNISGTLSYSKGGMLTGGTIGQALLKNSSTNYDSSWTTLQLDAINGTLGASKGGMLTGGTVGQVLAKVTSANYDSTWKSLTASDISGVATTRDVLRYISTTDSSAIAGTTAFSLIRSQLIPAGTFQPGDIVTIRQRIRKTGTGGVFLSGIYSNTTASLTGSLQLGVYSSTSAALAYTQMKRELFIKSPTSTETVFTNTSFPTDDITTTAVSSTNINWAIDQYILFVVQMASAADSTIQSGFIIELL